MKTTTRWDDLRSQFPEVWTYLVGQEIEARQRHEGILYLQETLETQDSPPASEPVGDELASLRQQLDRSKADAVTLAEHHYACKGDLRRMAAENQRLRAFVQSVADFTGNFRDNDDIALENDVNRLGSLIIAARALLDTEAAPDTVPGDTVGGYWYCTILADPLRRWYATQDTNEFIQPGRAMGIPAGDKVQIMQNRSIGTIPADCVVWEVKPQSPTPDAGGDNL